MTEEREAGVHEIIALGVFGKLGRHRPDDGQIIGARADLREEIADWNSALTVIAKLPRAGQQISVVVELRALDRPRQRFAGVLIEARLGIERIDLRHAAGHVAENDVFRARPKRRNARPERIQRRRSDQSAQCLIAKQARQRRQAESGRAPAEHLPA
jgi:hypothetical protein